jgi:hypothetical protein
MRIIDIPGFPGYHATRGFRVSGFGAFQQKQGVAACSTPATARAVTAHPMNVDLSIGFSPSVEERSP